MSITPVIRRRQTFFFMIKKGGMDERWLCKVSTGIIGGIIESKEENRKDFRKGVFTYEEWSKKKQDFLTKICYFKKKK
ncbi:hypothetical protein PFDG_01425 [Plasmodium falciparum Dd2]|uniref:Uncharacterized protein n=1 Tax=Plasmodium falciparum (isolate Dd2) TaxID=57267 RepID=A0A0L7LZM3_PLAF4|nr:hypothetical protein PFDG_01425 [Plasmodium falciparum Dd2]